MLVASHVVILALSIGIGCLGLMGGRLLNGLVQQLPVLWDATRQMPISVESLKFPKTITIFSLIQLECVDCAIKIPVKRQLCLLAYFLGIKQCTNCQKSLSLHFLVLEIVTAVLTCLLFYFFGCSPKFWITLGFSYVILLIACFDMEYYLVPDFLTLPLLWVGLFLGTIHFFVLPEQAIWGAVLGYGFLWLINALFCWCRGVDGIGGGDMKLLAALGAWLGAYSILPILILASIIALVLGVGIMIWKKYPFERPLPFAPFLGVSGTFLLLYYR